MNWIDVSLQLMLVFVMFMRYEIAAIAIMFRDSAAGVFSCDGSVRFLLFPQKKQLRASHHNNAPEGCPYSPVSSR